MSKKIKYFFSWVIIVLSIFGVLDEFIHDFSKSKQFYASFFPDKYFEKDFILYESQKSGAGSGGRGFYHYQGTLKINNKKASVFGDESFMRNLWSPDLEIPVWYCNLNGSVSIRTENNPPKPYSYNLLNIHIIFLMWLLFLPAIIYITSYQIQKRKTESQKN